MSTMPRENAAIPLRWVSMFRTASASHSGCASTNSTISGSRSPLRVADMVPPVGVSDIVV